MREQIGFVCMCYIYLAWAGGCVCVSLLHETGVTGQVRCEIWRKNRVSEHLAERENEKKGGGSDSEINLPLSPGGLLHPISRLQLPEALGGPKGNINMKNKALSVLSFTLLTKLQLAASQRWISQKGGETLNGGIHGNKHHWIPRQSRWLCEVVTGEFGSSVQFHIRGCFSGLRKCVALIKNAACLLMRTILFILTQETSTGKLRLKAR